MYLAEALIERKDLRNKVQEKYNEVTSNLAAETAGAYDCATVLLAALDLEDRIEQLSVEINTANNKPNVIDDMSIMQAIAKRDKLTTILAQLKTIKSTIGYSTNRRRTTTDIVLVPQLDVTTLAKLTEEVTVALSKLSAEIQRANWTVSL